MENNPSLCYVDTASMNLLKHAVDRCPNSNSLMLLNDLFEEHCMKFDNRDAGGINNFSGPLNLLLPNKHLTRSSKDWKTQLRNFKQPVEILALEGPPCENNCQKNSYSEQSDFSSLKNNGCNTSIRNVNNVDLTSFNTNESTELLPDLTDKRNTIGFKQKILPKNNSFANTSSNSNMFSVSQVASTISKSQFNLKSQLSEAHHSNNYENKCSSKETNESLLALNMQSKLPPKASMKYEMQSDKGQDKAKNAIFRTAREQLISTNPAAKKSLGTTRKVQSKFVSPLMNSDVVKEEALMEIDDNLKHIDPKMIELIQSEIIDHSTPIGWDDIAGLKMAKSVIQEAVVWPLLRPDIFTGLRRPPKGILLFGPPGTGKTLIGKCVASQCQATFFNISASSLTSKWIGDGEKMVRALFAVAKSHQPAVIFIDEIDSLLTQRSDAEHEATRRIKTEFLVQFDGAGTGEEERLLIIGATNRPQELDEAARRRLVKRLYIPLPDVEARKQIIVNLLKSERNQLRDAEIEDISRLTEGYSGADMKSLCSEAAMGPIRSVPLSQMVSIQSDAVRPVELEDFRKALERVRPSVSQDDLGQYVKWNKTYGLGY